MILSIIPYQIFPVVTGGRKAIALFTRYLAERTSLMAATVKSNDLAMAKGYEMVHVFSNSTARYINPFHYFVLRKLIIKNKVTHLLLEHPYFGWMGLLLKWTTGVQLVIRSHNIEAQRWKSLGKWWWVILKKYEALIHKNASLNFFIQDNDRKFAIHNYKLNPQRCLTITYGIERDMAPSDEEKLEASSILREIHHISKDEVIFLFNGTLDYQPNLNAVKVIVEHINPILLASSLSYKIIIAGKGLPSSFSNHIPACNNNILYTGFVEDIDVYFKGVDVFINPVIDGGGIKTKLVEALGWNTTCISSENGSVGILPEDTHGLLTIVPDGDWKSFALKMQQVAMAPKKNISSLYYNKFFWGNIADKALLAMDIRTNFNVK